MVRNHSERSCSQLTRQGRRLGRLRLVPSPVADHPPVKALGFDPVLNHPSLEQFKELLKRKKGTIKGVIMDQAFSAGVGNVSDNEITTSRADRDSVGRRRVGPNPTRKMPLTQQDSISSSHSPSMPRSLSVGIRRRAPPLLDTPDPADSCQRQCRPLEVPRGLAVPMEMEQGYTTQEGISKGQRRGRIEGRRQRQLRRSGKQRQRGGATGCEAQEPKVFCSSTCGVLICESSR